MRIEIQKITLENYKCFEAQKQIDFFSRTIISGKNKAGKSTIRDAYCDVITGKMSDGTQPDTIRPHNENGIDKDKVDCIRELHLKMDGKPVIIRKRTFQKWRKSRGQTEEVFDGNGVDYEIDGFPYKPKQFEEWMNKIINADILMMCSNATPFLTLLRKSTAEARKLLEGLSGFSTEQFITENSKYAHVSEITKGYSIEEVLKKLRKQLSEQKKKVDEQNIKIKYEKTRDTESPRIEIADLELLKGEWRDKLDEVDRQEQILDESNKVYDEMSKMIHDLKSKSLEIVTAERNKLQAENAEIDMKVSKAKFSKRNKENDLQAAEADLSRIESEIEQCDSALKKAREDYIFYSEQEFDETKLHKIEAEKFDENTLICPTCGQPFTSERSEKIREDFEKSKQKRIDDEKTLETVFYQTKEKKLDDIIEIGNGAQARLKAAKENKNALENEIVQIKKNIDVAIIEIKQLNAESENISREVDLSGNNEYIDLQRQISEKEKELKEIDNGSIKRAELRQKRNEYMSEISKIDSRIQKTLADEEEKVSRIRDLESELRSLSQVRADLERDIDLVSTFSREKNKALAQMVNPYFDEFDFVFLEYTIEGNPVETLKIVKNGTDYFGGLNYSDQILCNISLMRGLQRMNGLEIPIWIDNSESINAERIPNMEQQMDLLKVSEGDLRVEEMA